MTGEADHLNGHRDSGRDPDWVLEPSTSTPCDGPSTDGYDASSEVIADLSRAGGNQGGMLIEGEVNSWPIPMLVDTSSAVSLISEDLFCELGYQHADLESPDIGVNFRGADGTHLERLWDCSLKPGHPGSFVLARDASCTRTSLPMFNWTRRTCANPLRDPFGWWSTAF